MEIYFKVLNVKKNNIAAYEILLLIIPIYINCTGNGYIIVIYLLLKTWQALSHMHIIFILYI